MHFRTELLETQKLLEKNCWKSPLLSIASTAPNNHVVQCPRCPNTQQHYSLQQVHLLDANNYTTAPPTFVKVRAFVWCDVIFCQACNATKMRFSNQHLFFCRFFKYRLLLVLPYPQHDSPTMHQISFKYSLRCQNLLVP